MPKLLSTNGTKQTFVNDDGSIETIDAAANASALTPLPDDAPEIPDGEDGAATQKKARKFLARNVDTGLTLYENPDGTVERVIEPTQSASPQSVPVIDEQGDVSRVSPQSASSRSLTVLTPEDASSARDYVTVRRNGELVQTQRAWALQNGEKPLSESEIEEENKRAAASESPAGGTGLVPVLNESGVLDHVPFNEADKRGLKVLTEEEARAARDSKNDKARFSTSDETPVLAKSKDGSTRVMPFSEAEKQGLEVVQEVDLGATSAPAQPPAAIPSNTGFRSGDGKTRDQLPLGPIPTAAEKAERGTLVGRNDFADGTYTGIYRRPDGSTYEVPGKQIGYSEWTELQRREDAANSGPELGPTTNDPAKMDPSTRKAWLDSQPDGIRDAYLIGQGGTAAQEAAIRLRKSLGVPKATVEQLKQLTAGTLQRAGAPAQAPESPSAAPVAANQTPTPATPRSAFGPATPGVTPVSSGAAPAGGSPAARSASTSSSAATFRPQRVGVGGASPSTTKKLEDAYAAQQTANAEAASVGQQRAAAEAAASQEALKQAENFEIQRQQAAAERKQQTDKWLQDYQELEKKVFADTAKIDPDRWWNSRTTGQKVMAGISQFLTGFAGARNVIQDAINTDIAAQKDNADRLERRGQAQLASKMNLYGMMRQKFGDDIAAEAATQAASLNIVQQRLAAIGSQYKGPEIAAKLKEANALVEQQKQEKSAELRIRLEQLAIQRQAAAREAALAGVQLSAAKAKLANAMPAVPNAQVTGNTPVEALNEDQRERFVPGYGLATDKEAAKKGRETAAAYTTYKDSLNELIRWRKEYGTEKLDRAALATGNSLLNDVKIAYKGANNLGTLDNGSIDFMDKVFASDAGEIGFLLPKLEAIAGRTDEKFNKRLFSETGVRAVPQSFQRAR